MAQSIEELIAGTSRFFTPEAQNKMDEIAEAQRPPSQVRRKPSAKSAPVQPQPIMEAEENEDAWETAMSDLEGKMGKRQPTQTESLYPQQMQVPAGKNNCKIPSFIRESMLSNPIGKTDESVLSNVDLSQYEKKPKQRIVETAQPVAYAQGGIDYTIIKAIVNECLETKLKECFKSQLNESTIQSIGLKGGKITLTDNSGNVYSAQLKKVGNLNEMKG